VRRCVWPVTRVRAFATVVALAGLGAPTNALGAPPTTGPQAEPAQTANGSVSGAVSVVRGETKVPQGRVWVTLHRVAKDAAGAIDSVRTVASGAFHIRYRRVTDPGAVYFVSTVYAGIAYFSPALDVDAGAGSASEPVNLTVYDTTSAPGPIDVASRHIIVSPADGRAGREVTEVYIIVNAGDRTRVAGLDGSTFEVRLPERARDARIGDGDLPPDAVTITAGHLRVNSPIAPGAKRFSVSYRLDLTGGALAFGRDRPAAFVEVLVADSVTAVSGAALQEEAPVSLAAGTFRRFIASNVDAGAPLRVSLREDSGFGVTTPLAFVAVAALVMGVTLAAALRRRTPTRASTALAPVARAE